MKRDMDLARDILLALEARGNGRLGLIEVDIPERSRAEVAYHIMVLSQAGLIEATDLSSPGRFDWRARHLTWQGHEFIEAARNDTLWEHAKSTVIERTSGLALELLKGVLTQLGKQALGL